MPPRSGWYGPASRQARRQSCYRRHPRWLRRRRQVRSPRACRGRRPTRPGSPSARSAAPRCPRRGSARTMPGSPAAAGSRPGTPRSRCRSGPTLAAPSRADRPRTSPGSRASAGHPAGQTGPSPVPWPASKRHRLPPVARHPRHPALMAARSGDHCPPAGMRHHPPSGTRPPRTAVRSAAPGRPAPCCPGLRPPSRTHRRIRRPPAACRPVPRLPPARPSPAGYQSRARNSSPRPAPTARGRVP